MKEVIRGLLGAWAVIVGMMLAVAVYGLPLWLFIWLMAWLVLP